MAGIKITGNKGEWSELYVFAKLLAEGKLFVADNQLKKTDTYYTVVKVYRQDYGNEKDLTNKVYERGDSILFYKCYDDKEVLIKKFPLTYFQEQSSLLFKAIKAGKANNFNNISDFIQQVEIHKLTAPSVNKADIQLRIYDHRIAREEDLGFSIKSLIGGDSTLFNTGPGNNFIYQVKGIDKIDVNKFNQETLTTGKPSKITVRLRKLIDMGAEIVFEKVQSPQLQRNLQMIDGDLPKILASALQYRFIHENASLSTIVSLLEEIDPLHYYEQQRNKQRFYQYKVQKFLTDCALGMTSESLWMGSYDANGGVIIANEEEEVLCYHVYNFNTLREYLLNNTKFETASTSEDKENPGFPRLKNPDVKSKPKTFYYGWLYEEGGLYYIKINLQVRFK